MNKQVKLFIVEGEKRDARILNGLIKCFFQGKYSTKIIELSASQNIFMLYQTLKIDDFETDLVEVLRETVPEAKEKLSGITRQDISEIYMFFDYDIQQDNIKRTNSKSDEYSILKEMLSVFNNETENGKLFLSYPMVEAVYDYVDGSCKSFSGCYVNVENLVNYKEISGNGNPKAGLHFSITDWKEILNIFALRLKCLLDLDKLDFEDYQNNIDPLIILLKEHQIMNERDSVFVLSAFPEFLFEYFKKDFWNSNTKVQRHIFDSCPKT